MPLIEQGSVLLSAPGGHFALQQQYFHKSVILIVRHNEQGDMGLILNRPTALRAGDLDLPYPRPLPEQILRFFGMPAGSDSWNVWFGGDCSGLGPNADTLVPHCSCLHTTERLASVSEEVIRGVYIIDPEMARLIVSVGLAHPDEFMLLAGYCGWGPGQLQAELDRGGSWIMAAADQRALLGELRDAQAALTQRLEAARAREAQGAGTVTVSDIGDGLPDWERLRAALELETTGPTKLHAEQDEAEADGMLRRWIGRRLLRSPELAPLSLLPLALPYKKLQVGSVLRGSATEWLLGSPAALPGDGNWRMGSAQYLHKAVLLLLTDYKPDQPSILVLLDGPKIGTLSDDAGDVFFGGPVPPPPEVGSLLAVPGGGVWGCVELPAGLLPYLLALGALEMAEDVTLFDATAVPAQERWAAVGGRIRSLEDALTAAHGDAQRRRWYKLHLGLDIEAEK